MRGRLPKFEGSRNVPSERDSRETISDDLPLHREVEERDGEEAHSNPAKRTIGRNSGIKEGVREGKSEGVSPRKMTL